MAGATPTPDFARIRLDTATIAAGRTFGRIHRQAWPDPLGFGKHASRFSDPRHRVDANRFGVLYLGSTLKVCFLETIMRDQRDAVVGDLLIAEAEITDRLYSQVSVTRALTLIDLRGDTPVRMGIPSDVVRGRSQTLARRWSLAMHEHPDRIDGLIYPSRLNTEINLAIYDRAVAKLSPTSTQQLDRTPGISRLLDDFQVALT